MGITSTLPSSPEVTAYNGYDSILVDHFEMEIPYRGASAYFGSHANLPSENNLDASSLTYTLDSAGAVDGVIQVFRASMDNIHDIKLTLRGANSANDFTTINNCDSITGWTSNDTSKTPVSLSTTTFFEGTGSIQIALTAIKSNGKQITYAITPNANYTARDNFEFTFYSSAVHQFRVYLRDSTGNLCYFDWTTSSDSQWITYSIPFSSFTDYSIVNFASINGVIFSPIVVDTTSNVYVDKVRVTGVSGQVVTARLQLYDFGTNATPTSLAQGTQLQFDDITYGEGTLTELTKNLKNSKSIYHMHMHRGAHNTSNVLTVGNYYGLYLRKPTSGSIEVYGSATKTYNSGQLVTNTGGTLANTNKSMAFLVTSVGEAVLQRITINTEGSAKGTYVYVMLLDANNKLDKMFAVAEFFNADMREISIAFNPAVEAEKIVVNKSPKLMFYVQDSFDSQCEELEAVIRYVYKRTVPWG